ARDWFSVGHGDGHVRSKVAGSARRIHLPAAPGNGVTVVHKESVAGIFRGEGIAAFVQPQDRVSAAVDKIVNQLAVSFFRVHRLEDHEIHAILYVAPGIERGAVYIDDARVAGGARIQFAVGGGSQNFVRSGRAECRAAKSDLSFGDDQPGNARPAGRGVLLRDCPSTAKQRESHDQNANDLFHVYAPAKTIHGPHFYSKYPARATLRVSDQQ